jgi:hypothetical protein
MTTKYHITVKMIFNKATDRDAWYTKLKTAAANLKTTNPTPETFYIEKDEQVLFDNVRETL